MITQDEKRGLGGSGKLLGLTSEAHERWKACQKNAKDQDSARHCETLSGLFFRANEHLLERKNPDCETRDPEEITLAAKRLRRLALRSVIQQFREKFYPDGDRNRGTGRTRAARILYNAFTDPSLVAEHASGTALTPGEIKVIDSHIGGLLIMLKVDARLPKEKLLQRVDGLTSLAFNPGTLSEDNVPSYLGLCLRGVLEMSDFRLVPQFMSAPAEQPTLRFTRAGVQVVKELIEQGKLKNNRAVPLD